MFLHEFDTAADAKCWFCGAQFKRPSQVRAHARSVHTQAHSSFPFLTVVEEVHEPTEPYTIRDYVDNLTVVEEIDGEFPQEQAVLLSEWRW